MDGEVTGESIEVPTPDTTNTGFTDGMGLAVTVGHCWKEMARCVPGFSAVAERDVVLAGVRAMEPAEEERLAASDVSVVGADRIGLEGPGTLEAALACARMLTAPAKPAV